MAIHIQKSHQGRLHRALGIAQGRPIPRSTLMQASHNRQAHRASDGRDNRDRER